MANSNLGTSPRPQSGRRDELRAEELADQAGITVQLLRSYQSKGLLPPPRHEGRVAWYGPHHAERLRVIRDLKDRGYTLKMVHAALLHDHNLGLPLDEPAETLRLHDVAERSGLPAEMVRALEASHLLRPHRLGRTARYSDDDVRAVRQVLTLLGAGMSLDEFLRIAQPQLDTVEALATRAAAVWMRGVEAHGRSPHRTDQTESEWVTASLQSLVSAVSGLVAYNAERAVFNAAQEVVGERGSAAARDAVRRELARRHPDLVDEPVEDDEPLDP